MKYFVRLFLTAIMAVFLAQPVMAEKFKNKDTAESREDIVFGTRDREETIVNEGGAGKDVHMEVNHPDEDRDTYYNRNYGPIYLEPDVIVTPKN